MGEPRDLRIVFFGMEGLFSRAPLRALLAQTRVAAVVVPPVAETAHAVAPEPLRVLAPPARPRGAIPLLTMPSEPTVVGLAWQAGVTVLEVSDLAHPRTLESVRALEPDAICVACFPRLLPAALLALPRHGAFNVHPSLLPAYRGPAPLFWVLHQGSFSEGLLHSGVTVHALDSGADSGDVVAQRRVELPDDITYSHAERLCAEVGAELLLEALQALAMGRLHRTPQRELGVASRAPTPRAGDFIITPEWSARRAFNFIRALAEWEQPIILRIGDENWTVREAHSFDQRATLPAPIQYHNDVVCIRCSPGVLTVSLA